MSDEEVRGGYEFGLFLAALAVFCGCALILLGVVIAPQALAVSSSYGHSPSLLEGLALMLPGIGLAASGLALAVLGVIARAVIDMAMRR